MMMIRYAFVFALVALCGLRLSNRHHVGETAASRRRRLGRTSDKGTPTLSPEVVARPFTLAQEVTGRRKCRLRPRTYGRLDAVGLSIARAGSETVHLGIKQIGVESHHFHECTLADYAEAGARRVLVSLRDPVSRLVSGFQRRMEDIPISTRKPANNLFREKFKTLDTYIDALLAPSDALHEEALKATYGGKSQNFLLPVEEFYLSTLPRAPLGRVSQSGSEVEVRYACIENLTQDIEAIAQIWDLRLDRPREGKDHASASSSDSNATKRKFISGRNVERINDVYARDRLLHERHCVNRPPGAEPDAETFLFSRKLAKHHSPSVDRVPAPEVVLEALDTLV